MPAFRAAASTIQGVANVVMTMSPGTKQLVAHFVEMAVAVAGASKAFSLISGVVAGISSVISLLVGAALPLLAIVAALAAVAAATLFLHKVWRENWGGIQQIVEKFAGSDGPLHAIGQFFIDLGKLFLDSFVGSVVLGMNLVVTAISKALEGMAKLRESFGDTQGAEVARQQAFMITRMAINMQAGIEGTATSGHIGDTLAAGFKDVGGKLKSAGGALADEAKLVFAPMLKMLDDLFDRFKGGKGTASGRGNLDMVWDDAFSDMINDFLDSRHLSKVRGDLEREPTMR
jgi:hypothetical protein